jgi:hypothetical protein
MDRQWMINFLINGDLKNETTLSMLLRYGSRGYDSWTDAELTEMVEQRKEDKKMAQVDALTEEALEVLSKFVQDKLGIDYGDVAGQFWASYDHSNIIRSYIQQEIEYQGE